jgi:hypothetical protein
MTAATEIKPNWCFVRLDETDDWNLPDSIKAYVAKVYGIYAFNRNSHTHCCEITPSYWMIAIAWDFEPTEALNKLGDRERDNMLELIEDTLREASLQDSCHYRHVAPLEKVITSGKCKCHEAGELSDEVHPLDALCEYWNPNPKF